MRRCDDCMTSWIVAQRAAATPTVDTLYNRLKKLDPHHVSPPRSRRIWVAFFQECQHCDRCGQVVIGAIESIDMFVFEHKNIFVPEASLDVPM